MSNITTGLIVMISIQVLMFFMQVAVININPDAGVFYNGQGTIACEHESGGCVDYNSREFVFNSTDFSGDLPDGEGGVSPDTGNLFTDVFTSIRGFFMDTLGLKYLVMFLTAPVSVLSAMNLPSVFTVVVSGMWYAIAFFLLVSFLWGRDA